MNSQVSLFDNEESEKLHYYRGGSHASLIALLDTVKHLLMSVIYGLNIKESFAKLNQSGSWEKMFQGYSQVKMDGSLEEYSEICPKWGMMLHGVLYEQAGPEPYIDEREYSLLPTPLTSDGEAWKKTNRSDVQNSIMKTIRNGSQNRITYYPQYLGLTATRSAELVETIMGFPKGWTDLNV